MADMQFVLDECERIMGRSWHVFVTEEKDKSGWNAVHAFFNMPMSWVDVPNEMVTAAFSMYMQFRENKWPTADL